MLAQLEAVPVLHADDRRDQQGLGQLIDGDVGDAQVADQAGVAELGQRAEALGDGLLVRPAAQVHHVEVVAAELAQVLLDLAAQLVGAGRGPFAPRIPARPPLVVTTRSPGYGARAVLISSLAERRA